jgi:hypothetical protein
MLFAAIIRILANVFPANGQCSTGWAREMILTAAQMILDQSKRKKARTEAKPGAGQSKVRA